MKKLIPILLIIHCLASEAQIRIQGTVSDEEGTLLSGANVFIAGTWVGTTTDTAGHYVMEITERDTIRLVVSFIGYRQEERMFTAVKNIRADFVLKTSVDAMQEVVITAGSFSAGERKRAGKMDPLDIVTTANAEADVYAALSTLPGAQTQGETGKIIVRGGESHETKTYMDGLLVSSPYTANMPDMPARGRFTPFLFSGVMFSTGGYSAEYGQALSSVLELNSTALAEEDLISISLMNVGLGASLTKRMTNASYTLEGNYTNMWPYFKMARHTIDWTRYPESVNLNGRYRQKTGTNGMVKAFVNYDDSYSGLEEEDPFTRVKNSIGLHDRNVFGKVSYATTLNEKWLFKTGAAWNMDNKGLDIDEDRLDEDLQSVHMRAGWVNYTTDHLTMKGGLDYFYTEYKMKYDDQSVSQDYAFSYADNLPAVYLESDIRVNGKMALRLGGRYEYSSVLNKMNVAPRASMAYKLTGTCQVSFAYGKYKQNPYHDYLIYNKRMDFEQSSHFILNYQYEKNKRLLRMELFRKNYSQLVRYQTGPYGQPADISNGGNGYAQGFDLFWRDQRTIPFLDYWLSYSYTDTERFYKDYPEKATPYFVSKHSLSVVGKYWLSILQTQISLSWNFRSGRPYYNPAATKFHSDHTKPYNDVSGSLSHLTRVFDQFTIVHFSFSNLLGFDNVYGYRYAEDPDDSGKYASRAITPFVKRTFVIGVFISIE